MAARTYSLRALLLHRLATDARDGNSRRPRWAASPCRPRDVRSPMTQIGLGILVGLFLAIGISGGNGVGVVLMYGSVILAISSFATLGPVRRALRIQPTEALRAE